MGIADRIIMKISSVRGTVISLIILALIPSAAWADQTDDIINRGLSRTKSSAAAQKRIDQLADQTDKIISQRVQETKLVEDLKFYNDRMRRTLTAQEEGMVKLERSIEDASLIERQIVPLMIRMIAGLDKFIEADLPFKQSERRARLDRIKGYLTNANISAAERFRQVLEAYSTENAYGTSVDVYTDTLSLSGGDLTVNILQVGRSGLYYQTLDGNDSGYWDKAGKTWQELDSSHNEGITHAIRIAQGKESKGLMRLPVIAPEAF